MKRVIGEIATWLDRVLLRLDERLSQTPDVASWFQPFTDAGRERVEHFLQQSKKEDIMSKKDIGDRIQEIIKDVVTLDVLTLTGTIEITPVPRADNDDSKQEIQWKQIFDAVTNGANFTDSKLRVVAYSHVEIDCDTINFFREVEDPAGDKELRELHVATVEAASKTRYEAVTALGRLFGVGK